MRTVLHTSKYTGVPLEILTAACPQGFSVKTLDEASHARLVEEIPEADYLLVSGRIPIDKEALDAARRLKMIQRTGVGTEMLDLDEIRRRGIPVYVNKGVNARSVAEHTLTLMLACLKRLPEVNAQVHAGVWEKQATGVTTHELYGKRVGLVGLGHIGRLVASLLHAFGAEVFYTDLFRQPEELERQLGLSFCDSVEAMLPMVDILSLHCPQTGDNIRMMNERTFSMMKRGAVLINTARGRLVDPDALYDAVLSGRLSAAGLDTHFEEPLPAGSKLALLPNVILTPHIGGLSYETFHAMMAGAMKNIAAFDRGELASIEGSRLKI